MQQDAGESLMPGTGLPSAEEFRVALSAADFPAGKEDLVRMAEEGGAGERVLAGLRSLPLGDYDNVDEVVRSVDTVEASGTTPSEHAAQAQARPGGQPGLAQNQRTAGRG
jgi:hypothetical protein